MEHNIGTCVGDFGLKWIEFDMKWSDIMRNCCQRFVLSFGFESHLMNEANLFLWLWQWQVAHNILYCDHRDCMLSLRSQKVGFVLCIQINSINRLSANKSSADTRLISHQTIKCVSIIVNWTKNWKKETSLT